MKDGGSAFPLVERSASGGERVTFGLSMRDYFAAHAPVEPQPWFSPDTSHRTLRRLTQPEIAKIMDEERRKQWPYAWADTMLAERDKDSA